MRRGLATIVVGLAAACALTIPAAASAEEFQVPWTVDAALSAQAAAPDSAPPGANDFDCKPSRKHPQPVILAHGLLANQTVNWRTISPFLKNRGFCVFSLTYGTKEGVDSGFYQPGGLEKMQSSARELKRFVKRVRTATGARKVDIVGHSEGSLMPNWYVRFQGGAKYVDDYVAMTPLWGGTDPAGLATLNTIGVTLGLEPVFAASIDQECTSCRQFLQGSRFMQRMHAKGITSNRVQYTNIVTKNDELVMPYTSGILPKAPNVTNVVLQDYCNLDQAEHVSVFADPVTAGFVYGRSTPSALRTRPARRCCRRSGRPATQATRPSAPGTARVAALSELSIDEAGQGDPDVVFSEEAHRQNPLNENMSSNVIVLFGATGDLSKRKLLPGLLNLCEAGLLPPFRVVGAARQEMSTEDFRKIALDACKEFGRRDFTAAAARRVRRPAQLRRRRRSRFGEACGGHRTTLAPSSDPTPGCSCI